MDKDERIKELELASIKLFDMVHESENIQNKIKANDLYDTIKGQALPVDSVSNCECKNLPEGEIAISSKALTNPNWKG